MAEKNIVTQVIRVQKNYIAVNVFKKTVRL